MLPAAVTTVLSPRCRSAGLCERGRAAAVRLPCRDAESILPHMILKTARTLYDRRYFAFAGGKIHDF
jgi:hypothetical protein